MPLADQSMRTRYRGLKIELSGGLLTEVMEALINGHGYSRFNATLRTESKDYWKQEAKEMGEACNAVWELVRKAERKRLREKKRLDRDVNSH